MFYRPHALPDTTPTESIQLRNQNNVQMKAMAYHSDSGSRCQAENEEQQKTHHSMQIICQIVVDFSLLLSIIMSQLVDITLGLMCVQNWRAASLRDPKL